MTKPAPYRKSKPKKLAERKDPLAVTQAPCCGRCQFWARPRDPERDPFGTCGRAFLMLARVQRLEKGMLITRQERDAMDLPSAFTERMRVRSWAPACSQYVDAVATVDEIDPEPDEPAQLRLLREERTRYIA